MSHCHFVVISMGAQFCFTGGREGERAVHTHSRCLSFEIVFVYPAAPTYFWERQTGKVGRICPAGPSDADIVGAAGAATVAQVKVGARTRRL